MPYIDDVEGLNQEAFLIQPDVPRSQTLKILLQLFVAQTDY